MSPVQGRRTPNLESLVMDAILSIALVAMSLLLVSLGLGLTDQKNFRVRWLLLALALLVAEDALLTNLYGLLPSVVPGDWNWQGKGLALLAMLVIGASPGFGWERIGLTLRQRSGSLRACLPVVAIYLSFFIAVGLVMPNEPVDPEDLGFQLTMPGAEEELFYRGVLLLALNEAFRRRWHFLGIDWGWGALLSSALFGLAHAFSLGSDGIAFDPIVFALTAVPSLLGVWLRERSGSLVLPFLVHNAGNALPMIF